MEAQANDTARQRTIEAAGVVWSAIGRDGRGLEPEHYTTLFVCLRDLLHERFANRFDGQESVVIVEHCLHSYIIPLYIRHIRADSVNPDDVPGMLENAALDRWLGALGVPGCLLGASTLEADDAVVQLIFSNEFTAEAYEQAISYLRVTGSPAGPLAYIIVTQFVDLTVTLGKVPAHAEVIRSLGALTTRYAITEQVIGMAMLRFAGLLGRF
jgi:hypothetical protein